MDEDEVLLDITRAVMAISVRTTAADDGQVSAVQLRALTVLSQLGQTNLIMLAEALGIGRSATSRLCDRMVAAGLVDRSQSEATRREIVLTLSSEGKRLLNELDAQRLRYLRDALDELPAHRRRTVLRALAEFADATARQVGTARSASS